MAVLRDPFQSDRARKRAALLLQIAGQGDDLDTAATTGASVDQMIARFKVAGVRGALLGVERKSDKRRYDVEAVARVLRELVVSRPPSGVYWSVKALADGVVHRLPETSGITEEYVRSILAKKLGIKSVRHIEPYWLQQHKKRAVEQASLSA